MATKKRMLVSVGTRVAPEPKVTAGTLAAAIMTLVVYVAKTYFHQEIPAEPAMAVTTLLTLLAAYVTPHLPRIEDSEDN